MSTMSPVGREWLRCAIVTTAAAVIVSCGDAASAAQAAHARQDTAGATARFVQHTEHIQPGLPLRSRFAALANPFEGDQRRTAEGAKLFIAYNCSDCHGAEGSGAMGPSLQDSRWHFGGSPAEIYESIYEGRPDGMPAWGGRIADDQIWRLVAYVRSLSSGHDVATENFTGHTVERSGH